VQISTYLDASNTLRKMLGDTDRKDSEPDITQLALLSLSGGNDTLRNMVRMMSVGGNGYAREYMVQVHKLLHALMEEGGKRAHKTAMRACSTANDVLFPMGVEHYRGRTGDKNLMLKTDQFPFIPASADTLPNIASKWPEFFKGKKFVDVGCGPGEKVFHAALLSKDMECRGIEFDHAMVAVANNIENEIRLFGGRVRFKCADATTLDFSRYDRVYTYIPIQGGKELEKFYTRIWDTLPDKAMWFEVDGNGLWSELGRKIRGATSVGKSRHMMRLPAKRPAKKKGAEPSKKSTSLKKKRAS